MTRLTCLICLCVMSILSFGQNDVSASFPGGDEAYDAYLRANLIFPDKAIESRTTREIRVVVEIDSTGKVRIQEYVYPNSGLGFEEEVKRFIDHMPLWNPAVHNGVVANSQMVLNFNFTYIDPEIDFDTQRYTYYTESEVPPTFVGGLDSIKRFVKTMMVDTFNFDFDTVEATIQFVVGADSSIIDAQVLLSDNQIPDDYWVYVIRSLPNGIPGRIRKKRVNVQSTLSLVIVSEASDDS